MQGWRNAQSCSELMWESDCGFVPVIGSNGDGALAGVTTDRHMAMATYIQGNRRRRFLYRA